MITINERNTVQKELVLRTVRSLCDHPTAEEIYKTVSGSCPGISRGTVYRNLGKLAEDGKILRVAVANAPDRFDRTVGEHCHFLCLSCGCVYDLEGMRKIDLSAVKCGEGARAVGCDVVVRGYCGECEKNNTERKQ